MNNDEYLVSNVAFERIVNLMSKGYDVLFRADYGDQIQIRITKGNVKAARYISIDELRQSKIDFMLWTINQLVNMVDDGIERSRF